jgi:hypothetical protein
MGNQYPIWATSTPYGQLYPIWATFTQQRWAKDTSATVPKVGNQYPVRTLEGLLKGQVRSWDRITRPCVG